MSLGCGSEKEGSEATKIKIIAPGDSFEITPGGAMVYDRLYGLEKQFQGWRCSVCGAIVEPEMLSGRQLMGMGF